MKQRCPSASFVNVAALFDFRLAFTRKSKNRGCGVADIVSSADSKVWGVIFRIDETDVGKLDASEGYVPGRATNAYRRIETRVFADANRDKPMTVWTYEVIDKSEVFKPNDEYKALLVEGARYWHLPDDYIEVLAGLEVQI